MEKIIQLTEYKYNKLIETAKLKEQEIEQRAKKLFEDNGFLGVLLDLNMKDQYKDFKIHTYIRIHDWESMFKLKYSDEKRIIKYIDEKVQRLIKIKYGDYLSVLSNLYNELDKVKRTKTKFLVFTITGWFIAIILTVINLKCN